MSIGGSKSKSSSTSDVWGTQSPYLEDLYSRSSSLMDQQAPQLRQNPYLSTGYDLGADYALGGANDIYNMSLGGFSDALNAADVNNNPYLSGAMDAAVRPLTENYTEQVLPSIRSDSIGAGQLGSSRQGIAEGIASRGYLDSVGDVTARMGSDAYNAGLQSRNQALSMAPSIQNLGFGGANYMRGIGGEVQQADLYNQQSPYWQLGQYSGLLGNPTVLGSSSSRSSGFNFTAPNPPPPTVPA